MKKLTTEKRESLVNLLCHPSIQTISITDYISPNGELKTYVDIHTQYNADHENVLLFLAEKVGAKFEKNKPLVSGEKIETAYKVDIEGVESFLSNLYFTEAKEKPSAPTESIEENINREENTQPDYTTESEVVANG